MKDRAGSSVGMDCKGQEVRRREGWEAIAIVQVSDGHGLDSGEDRGDREHLVNSRIYFRGRINKN